jgi:hypothetical protein
MNLASKKYGNSNCYLGKPNFEMRYLCMSIRNVTMKSDSVTVGEVSKVI